MKTNDTTYTPITFTPLKLALLKKHYTAAVRRGDETFTFDGQEILTAYAKYMIKYLQFTTKWGSMKRNTTNKP